MKYTNPIGPKPAFNTKMSIVSKKNCRLLNAGQFCLDAVDVFVLKANFELIGFYVRKLVHTRPLPSSTTHLAVVGCRMQILVYIRHTN